MEKTITNKTWESMFGYDPGLGIKKLILDEVRNTGCDIREAAAKYQLPQIALLDADGRFYCEKYGRITPAEWEERNPLGKFGRIVILTPTL